jgi:hypothetical protein
MQVPFRILNENKKYYVVDENGVIFEANDKNLRTISDNKPEPIALLFNKDTQKNVQSLRVSKLAKEKNIYKQTLKKYTKRLIKN